jgi:hypothetical protein
MQKLRIEWDYKRLGRGRTAGETLIKSYIGGISSRGLMDKMLTIVSKNVFYFLTFLRD